MQNADINPWRTIWLSPRKAMRFILDKDPTWMVILLTVIGGIVAGLSFASLVWSPFPPRDFFHKLLLIATLSIAGIILNLIHLYINGWLLALTGSWIRGRGKFIELKCAVGWSNYPALFSNLALILSTIARGSFWIMNLFALIQIVLAIWALVISIGLIAEAHRFSIWRAIGSVILAALLVSAVIVIIALLTPLLSPLFQ